MWMPPPEWRPEPLESTVGTVAWKLQQSLDCSAKCSETLARAPEERPDESRIFKRTCSTNASGYISPDMRVLRVMLTTC